MPPVGTSAARGPAREPRALVRPGPGALQLEGVFVFERNVVQLKWVAPPARRNLAARHWARFDTQYRSIARLKVISITLSQAAIALHFVTY